MLGSIHLKKPFRRYRESSYDQTGANTDSIRIEPGGTYEVPVLEGPGIVKHIWMTLKGGTDLYRDMQLCFYFDESERPQVAVPVGDFYLFGHGEMANVNSLPIQVSRQPHIKDFPYFGSMNCLFPMPFEKNARLHFTNLSKESVGCYYYIDWEKHDCLEEPVLNFHASFREENTCPPKDQPQTKHGSLDSRPFTNTDWSENYLFLNVDHHQGHYVGTGLSIECKPNTPGKWWEGDDMFIIDGEPWPPRLHGTGTEDYFNLAWGFRKVECRPEYGITFLQKTDDDSNQIDGRFSMYRFHLNDPIPFEQSLIGSIEHGHANDCEALYRSVAYWYGRPK